MSFRTFKNAVYSLILKSDVRRWSNIGNHDAERPERTLAMSKYIQAGESVFEFGAGHCHLEEMLPINCSYTPSDIAKRASNTYVCDLNKKPLPAFPRHDVAVCSEVLEYVHDLDHLLQTLAQSFDRLIASYADIDRNPKIWKRVSNGWFNHLSRRKLLGKFEAVGYRLDREEAWETHGIYVFKLDPPGGTHIV